jgi:hypothetical protein
VSERSPIGCGFTQTPAPVAWRRADGSHRHRLFDAGGDHEDPHRHRLIGVRKTATSRRRVAPPRSSAEEHRATKPGALVRLLRGYERPDLGVCFLRAVRRCRQMLLSPRRSTGSPKCGVPDLFTMPSYCSAGQRFVGWPPVRSKDRLSTPRSQWRTFSPRWGTKYPPSWRITSLRPSAATRRPTS